MLLFLITGYILIASYLDSTYLPVRTLLFLVASFAITVLSSPVTCKFLLFLILAPWYELHIAKNRAAGLIAHPLVSVIIPAWNEEVGIVTTLKSVLASSYREVEIIVVNDGSTDNSDSVIRTFLEKYERSMQDIPHFIPIYYYYQSNQGKGAALNTGIRLSHGDIIVCIDADGIISKHCILEFVLALQDSRIAGVCGNVKVANTGPILATIQMYEYALSFYARKTDALLNTLYVVSGAAGAYRREVFYRVGYYDTALRGGGEDVDLSIRVQQAGMKIAFAPGAIVYTEVPTTLKSLTKQRLRWTRSRFETFRRYPRFVFSMKKGQNKLLTCFVLPLILFNDWFYIIKMLLKTSIYVYCVISHTYQLLAMLMLLTTLISALPLWNNKGYRKYLMLTPIYWLLSFIPSFIELYAVSLSLWGIWRKREVKWQNWQREGVIKG